MIILLILIGLIFFAAIVSALVCSYKIKVAYYDETIEGLGTECRVVLISDLHSRQYGEGNSRLKALIAEQKPDAIFMVGDMLSRNSDETDISEFAKLLFDLKDIAPVYYTIGNHENEFSAELLKHVKSAVTAAEFFFIISIRIYKLVKIRCALLQFWMKKNHGLVIIAIAPSCLRVTNPISS